MVENKLNVSPIKYLIIDGKDTNNYKTRNAIEEVLQDTSDLFIPFSQDEIPINAIQKNKDYESMEFAFDSRNGKFVTHKVLFGSEYNEINKEKHHF